METDHNEVTVNSQLLDLLFELHTLNGQLLDVQSPGACLTRAIEMDILIKKIDDLKIVLRYEVWPVRE